MIRLMLRRFRAFASVGGWSVIGVAALTIGLGWYALRIPAADAALSAQPDFGSGVGSLDRARGVRSSEVFTLTVLHTNDTWGYVDPCG
jgi:hypothetical protein